MSPKSLLRHKLCVSTLEDLSDGQFQLVIDDVDVDDHLGVKKIILCSGRVYYDLLEKRRGDEIKDTALVRIEQLYPFPEDELYKVVEKYPNLEKVVWCQEEPMNQGAWYCSQHHMRHVLHQSRSNLHLHYAGRNASAAPACGYMSIHIEEQQKLVNDAFDI